MPGQRKRDYKAEYQRRQSLAKARGFRSYGQQRRAIEKGTVAAIAPSRIRTKRTADAQFRRVMNLPKGWTVRGARMDMARGWSNAYARSDLLTFDEKRAQTDDVYLDAYIKALVFAPSNVKGNKHHRRLTPSPDLEEFLVNVLGIYQADEYETRYGYGWPHGGQYNRGQRATYRANGGR